MNYLVFEGNFSTSDNGFYDIESVNFSKKSLQIIKNLLTVDKPEDADIIVIPYTTEDDTLSFMMSYGMVDRAFKNVDLVRLYSPVPIFDCIDAFNICENSFSAKEIAELKPIVHQVNDMVYNIKTDLVL
jgi:response regulator of citrate/malate metabolism